MKQKMFKLKGADSMSSANVVDFKKKLNQNEKDLLRTHIDNIFKQIETLLCSVEKVSRKENLTLYEMNLLDRANGEMLKTYDELESLKKKISSWVNS